MNFFRLFFLEACTVWTMNSFAKIRSFLRSVLRKTVSGSQTRKITMSYSPTATSSLHLDDFETRNMMDESQADFPPDDQQRILHELIQRNTQGISGQSDEHFDANNNSRPSTGTGSPQSRLSAPLTQIPASNTDANLVSAMKYFNNLEHLLKNGLNDLGMYKSEANRFLVEKQREFAELTNAAAKV